MLDPGEPVGDVGEETVIEGWLTGFGWMLGGWIIQVWFPFWFRFNTTFRPWSANPWVWPCINVFWTTDWSWDVAVNWNCAELFWLTCCWNEGWLCIWTYSALVEGNTCCSGELWLTFARLINGPGLTLCFFNRTFPVWAAWIDAELSGRIGGVAPCSTKVWTRAICSGVPLLLTAMTEFCSAIPLGSSAMVSTNKNYIWDSCSAFN